MRFDAESRASWRRLVNDIYLAAQSGATSHSELSHNARILSRIRAIGGTMSYSIWTFRLSSIGEHPGDALCSVSAHSVNSVLDSALDEPSSPTKMWCCNRDNARHQFQSAAWFENSVGEVRFRPRLKCTHGDYSSPTARVLNVDKAPSSVRNWARTSSLANPSAQPPASRPPPPSTKQSRLPSTAHQPLRRTFVAQRSRGRTRPQASTCSKGELVLPVPD